MIYTAWRAIRDVGVTINIFGVGMRERERAREGRRQREVSPAHTKAPRNALYTADRPKSSRKGDGGGEGRRKGPLFITSFNNVPKSKSRAAAAAGQQMFCRLLAGYAPLNLLTYILYIHIYIYYIVYCIYAYYKISLCIYFIL